MSAQDPVDLPMGVASPMAIESLHAPAYPVASSRGVTAGIRSAASTGPPAEAVVLRAEPPENALEAVQAAARAYEELRRSGRELRFESRSGIMRIEVYDGSGQLVRSIPPNEALAMASRDASWQA
jgi:hypothetical protein